MNQSGRRNPAVACADHLSTFGQLHPYLQVHSRDRLGALDRSHPPPAGAHAGAIPCSARSMHAMLHRTHRMTLDRTIG